MKTVFVDTNVWFSAFYGSKNAEQILKMHVENKIKVVISKFVLNELVKNIKQKIPQATSALEKFLESVPPKIINNPSKIQVVIKQNVDKKDQFIFQAAANYNANYFVTGNLKDFNLKVLEKEFDIRILSPKQFLQR